MILRTSITYGLGERPSLAQGRSFRYVLLLLMLTWSSISWCSEAQTGFLLVAPDRGFIGNQEIHSVFDDFKKSYAASLVLIGRDYNRVGDEYSGYLSRALVELKQAGATHIVAIPFFPSMSDPVLQKVIAYLPGYPDAGNIEWTAPMPESHLIGQILLDRVEAMSQDSEQERLIAIGIGAMDDASETALKADLDKLLTHVTRRKRFREVRAVLYYDREARSAEHKNKAVDTEIMRAGRACPGHRRSIVRVGAVQEAVGRPGLRAEREWVSPSHHHSMVGRRDRADNRLVVQTARRR